MKVIRIPGLTLSVSIVRTMPMRFVDKRTATHYRWGFESVMHAVHPTERIGHERED
jgi:hypothetical protein